jgi:hypothetical protein
MVGGRLRGRRDETRDRKHRALTILTHGEAADVWDVRGRLQDRAAELPALAAAASQSVTPK